MKTGRKRYSTPGSAIALWLWCCVALCAAALPAHAYDPLSGDYSKAHPLDVRIMTYNHAGNFISNSSRDAAFNRVLAAIDPDIICFQEFASNVSATAIANRLNAVLPNSGGSWQIHLGIVAGTRNVLASRYPLLLRRTDTIPTSSTRGVTIALADLPDEIYGTDVYLLGVHLKCCGDPGGSEDASRQRSADAIANWLADARGVARPSGDNVVLTSLTPMIALGDFNLVGGPQPEITLLTGDIQNNGTFGPDVKGDWDNTNITNLNPADPFTGATFTWQGSGSFPPSALDRVMFADAVLIIANSFVFNTATMTPAARTAAGVLASDTSSSSTSDHLPVAADLRLPGPAQCEDDAECSDGDVCTGLETCTGGACLAGPPLDCDDGDPCTVDTCDPLTGCAHEELVGACDDGDGCTVNEVCIDGECVGTPMDCDDGNPCNGVEACVDGECSAGTPPNCSDGNPCTDDSCDPGTGCVHTPNTAACNDGSACTLNDVCAGGVCAGTPIVCNDGNVCTDDFCLGGTCYFLENVEPCDDGDACTQDDVCWLAVCAGTPRNCDDRLYCNGVESCDTGAGCLAGDSPCAASAWCDEAEDACMPFGSGDFDGNGRIDLADFAAFQACFGQSAEGACTAGNLVGNDQQIDAADLAAFIVLLEGA